MLFSDHPERYFRGARIEIAQFADDAGGDLIEEKYFSGPLSSQILQALAYMNSLAEVMVRKIPKRAEVERAVAYPYEAMEEALVNAIYHRSYEPGVVEPTKVYLYPDRIEIISYPGPVPGITRESLNSDRPAPPAPARNRPIGEFLKELRLAEARGTGIPKIRRRMRENGSPPAVFDFEADWFRVTLPAHPQYRVLHALREAGRLWALGEKQRALGRLEAAYDSQPGSGALAGQIIEYAFSAEELDRAQRAFDRFVATTGLKTEPLVPHLRFAQGLVNRGQLEEAQSILAVAPAGRAEEDRFDLAILRKRTRDYPAAHRLFEEIRDTFGADPKYLHEFAQTKMEIARALRKDPVNRKRLLTEAARLLRQATQLSGDAVRQAWCHLDLARTLDWLEEPAGLVEEHYRKALALRPEDAAIARAFERWKSQRRG